MPSVFYAPSIESARTAFATAPGGPHHGIINRARYLKMLGWEPTDDAYRAYIVHVTGVLNPAHRIDVLTINAVWPVDAHPNPPSWWHQHNRIMRDAAHKARRVVALSEYTAAMIHTHMGIKATVIPQAIDGGEWVDVPNGGWRDKLGIGKAALVIWPKTSADWLRDPTPALHLADAIDDIHVVIPAKAAEVMAYAKREIPANVHCIGLISFPHFQTLLAEADLYLATTLESASNSQLEAMYTGTPVLGYAWGGAVEMTEGKGPAGILVEPGDVAGLVDAFAEVYRKRKSFGRSAKKRARERTWDKVAPLYVELYEGILNER